MVISSLRDRRSLADVQQALCQGGLPFETVEIVLGLTPRKRLFAFFPALEAVAVGLTTGPGALLPALRRVVGHCPERVLLPRHEIVDAVFEDFLEDESLSTQIRVVIGAGEDDSVAEIEEHDQVAAPALQEGLVAAAEPWVEPEEDRALQWQLRLYLLWRLVVVKQELPDCSLVEEG